MTASQGSAISAAKWPKASPQAANARRLVRLETGSSRDAEFARCVHAYTCGLARTSSLAAVANTTGVRSTTVASRLSTAVVTEAITNTCASSLRGRPLPVRAIHAPQAWNKPSSSHRYASTKMAARKPITGASCLAWVTAPLTLIAPVAIKMAAAGTAATASGQPRGLITAHARTANRPSKEIVSPTVAFSACLPGRLGRMARPSEATRGYRRLAPSAAGSLDPGSPPAGPPCAYRWTNWRKMTGGQVTLLRCACALISSASLGSKYPASL